MATAIFISGLAATAGVVMAQLSSVAIGFKGDCCGSGVCCYLAPAGAAFVQCAMRGLGGLFISPAIAVFGLNNEGTVVPSGFGRQIIRRQSVTRTDYPFSTHIRRCCCQNDRSLWSGCHRLLTHHRIEYGHHLAGCNPAAGNWRQTLLASI